MLSRHNDSREFPHRAGAPRANATGLAVRRGRWAFSMVEVLVVIGIISALMAILLPAVSLVRGWADNTKCLSNLKQIGTAILAYSNDHNGYLVPGDYFDQQDYAADPGIGINQYSPGNWADILVEGSYITAIGYAYAPGAQYAEDPIDRTSILSCPSGQDVDIVTTGGLPSSVTNGRGACFSARGSDIDQTTVKDWYGINCIVRAKDSSLTAPDLLPRPFSFLPDFGSGTANWQLNKLSQFQNDTSLPLVFDGVFVFYPVSSGVTPINARHGSNTYTNVLFADFHCESQLSVSFWTSASVPSSTSVPNSTSIPNSTSVLNNNWYFQ